MITYGKDKHPLQPTSEKAFKSHVEESSYDHLTSCEGCDWCNHLMSLYTACDECGHWMWNECEHYYDLETGIALCNACAPSEFTSNVNEGKIAT